MTVGFIWYVLKFMYCKTIMSPSKNNTVGVYLFEGFASSPSLSCKAN